MGFVEEQTPVTEGTASTRGESFAYRHTADLDVGDIGTNMPLFRQSHETSWPDQATTARAARPQLGRTDGLRVAIVHEWLDTYGGSERVLEQLLLCFPSADIFAVVDFMGERERSFLQGRKVQTSFVQRLPFARRFFRHYIGLMPIAMQQLDLSGYDLIISSNHAVAKGVLTGPDQVHISYVHSPMRYIWDLQHQYLGQMGIDRGLKSIYARWQFGHLRQWDVSTAHQVDYFVANSNYIARRIRRTYRRDAMVIHPPVDIDRFVPGTVKEDFFLLACRFVPYKRADVVVQSFAHRGDRRLVVVGDGPDADRVRAAARGAPNVEFVGVVGREVLIGLMQRARAFVFAAEEDFGITLVEAQACGTPVIAYGRGGANDIVRTEEAEGQTGLLFDRQTPDAITEAVDRFETLESQITGDACRMNALRFSEARFRAEITDVVDRIFG